jgi:hypothetical protein
MAEIVIYAPAVQVRIIRPLPEETEEHFRQRMQAMTALLAECDPSLVAVVINAAPGCLACVVSQVPARNADD